MNSDTATLPQIIEAYETALAKAGRFLVLVRDTGLQKKEVEVLREFKNRVKGFKYGAIQAKDEAAANHLFHMQCGVNAHISLLEMWIKVKERQYHDAWSSLIDAQEYVSIALRAADGGIGLEAFQKHLKKIEEVVFPGFSIYNSWGAIIKGGKCSVCGRQIDACDHIEGLVYWGRLCLRIHPDIVRMDHVSLVDEPRDRRCIITEISSDDGYYVDCMTLLQTRKTPDKDRESTGTFAGVFFSNQLLEID